MDDDSPTITKKTPRKTTARKNPRPRTSAKATGFVDSFKNEWSLFWEGLTGTQDGFVDDAEFGRMKPQPMSLKQIKEITRALSHEKMKLNQRLESIHREIEINTAKLQSLQLVGAPSEETLARINELTDQGQKLASELQELDQRLNLVRKTQVSDKVAAV